MSVYLIRSTNVARGQQNDSSLRVCVKPGRKNMSRAECTDGWLGQTGDINEYALGEFDDTESLIAAIEAEGFTVDRDELESWMADDENEIFEDITYKTKHYSGDMYSFDVKPDPDSSVPNVDNVEVKNGFTCIDQYWDGYGNESSEHERDEWVNALDGAGIKYEIAEYSARSSHGEASEFWMVIVADTDVERANAALELAEAE